jgi:hypothetical protein
MLSELDYPQKKVPMFVDSTCAMEMTIARDRIFSKSKTYQALLLLVKRLDCEHTCIYHMSVVEIFKRT